MTEHLLMAYREDIDIRSNGPDGASGEGIRVEVHELDGDGVNESGNGVRAVYEDINVKVEAFPVNHGNWPAFGYRFATPKRKIVISGDTTPVDTLIDIAKGCDVLIHEVYSLKGFQGHSTDWQR